MPKRYIYAILNAIVLISFIAALSSCTDPSGPSPESSSTIQPLSVGSSWVYADSIFTDSAVIVDTTRIKVGGKGMLHGQINNPEVFYWHVYSGENKLLRTNLIFTESTGLVHYAEIIDDDTLYAKKFWAKYPVEIGDSFDENRYKYDPSSGVFTLDAVWKWKCVSKTEKITLASGDVLNCIVFEAVTGADEVTSILYTLNVGYAGWITKKAGKTVFKETLSYYNLN